MKLANSGVVYQSLEYSELVRMSFQELPDQGTDDAVSESRGNAE
jgi:hypothetical protein